ncbi:hypothetical protein PAMP_001018 [Pampus punctatissimus]
MGRPRAITVHPTDVPVADAVPMAHAVPPLVELDPALAGKTPTAMVAPPVATATTNDQLLYAEPSRLPTASDGAAVTGYAEHRPPLCLSRKWTTPQREKRLCSECQRTQAEAELEGRPR